MNWIKLEGMNMNIDETINTLIKQGKIGKAAEIRKLWRQGWKIEALKILEDAILAKSPSHQITLDGETVYGQYITRRIINTPPTKKPPKQFFDHFGKPIGIKEDIPYNPNIPDWKEYHTDETILFKDPFTFEDCQQLAKDYREKYSPILNQYIRNRLKDAYNNEDLLAASERARLTDPMEFMPKLAKIARIGRNPRSTIKLLYRCYRAAYGWQPKKIIDGDIAIAMMSSKD
jgi:hypothetical protein